MVSAARPGRRRREPAVPLVDWGTMAVRGGRSGPYLPNMAWVVCFPDAIDQKELDAEVERINALPHALGRRLRPARLPGAHPRWVAADSPAPPVRLARENLDRAGLRAWIDEHLATPLDPEHGAGWRLWAVTTEDGGTAVLLSMHHVFGTARGVWNALYGGDEPPWTGTTGRPLEDTSRYGVRGELRGLGERFALGARALRHLPADLRAERAAAAVRTGPPPPQGRDRSRPPNSERRVAGVLDIPDGEWDAAARRHGGTANTLLTALLANLVRRARLARGGDPERTLRLILPVELPPAPEPPGRLRSSTPIFELTTAPLVLPGGPPVHGDLGAVRAMTKAAFRAAVETRASILGDVMRLVPESVALRAAVVAAEVNDGCATNPGQVPPGLLRLGEHRANRVVPLGFPIGNETIATLARDGDRVSVSVVTDPARLGGGDLCEWLRDEVERWDIRAEVW